jgi:AraC-type DNA-binding domain-containing proteins
VAISASAVFVPTVVVHVSRDRSRALARELFPRKRWRVVLTQSAAEMSTAFRGHLVDAALIDTAHPDENTWQSVALAADYPSVPFFCLSQLRPADAVTVGKCVGAGCVECDRGGVDEPVARQLVTARSFSARFRRALGDPPESLGLITDVQHDAWRAIVSFAGTPVTTVILASALGLSREHLSRKFAAGGGPNLKRIIDLVRLLAAAELSKNPGYDVRDVAKVLGFASSSHLAVAAGRISGTRPASLSRLRSVDLIERFAQGRTRSRG